MVQEPAQRVCMSVECGMHSVGQLNSHDLNMTTMQTEDTFPSKGGLIQEKNTNWVTEVFSLSY